MELVKVKIIKTVITARYGALSPGDILNTDVAFAKHLVDDCGAARFEAGIAAESTAEPEKPRKARTK